ncbi:MAG TPA: hypothetical protein VMT35_01885 [Ignavibacteriaceae bacterium]|nr:hypothetical protein [Ignavibacteriaceae bacterium]
MGKPKKIIVFLSIVLVLALLVILLIPEGNPVIKKYKFIDRSAHIFPDYTEIVIPPNIAPLNFMIKERGVRYSVKIASAKGEPIEISSDDSKIIIPIDRWKELVSQNRGGKLQVEIYLEDINGIWYKFKNITNQIAYEKIDQYLAYRLINPAYNLWRKLGIYQRNLENYDESPILLNRATNESCMNCHSFRSNDPNYMLVHLRKGPASGTLISTPGNLLKVNTSTAFNQAGAYPAWHPNGKLIAMSVNKLSLFYHSIGEPRDVLDHGSDLILYSVESNMVTTCPGISDPGRMETFPAWSPDGKYLYFSSAPKLESFFAMKDSVEELLYNNIRYDLMRIRYFPENGTWGKLDTVLSSSETGLSLTEPRVSPDGHYLLFTASDYGNFPIYLKSSDIYMLDLKTGKYYKPGVNSDKTDSFHSWSSNSHWFVFSSKRIDSYFTRFFFSYVDKDGKAYKPFLLPQEDPEFYSTFLYAYNVPELIKGPVTVSPQELIKTAYDPGRFLQAQLDPKVLPHETKDSLRHGLKPYLQ